MSEPIGWNVYVSGTGFRDLTFREFLPNEPVLAREAERLAGEAEAFAMRAGSFEVSGTIAVEFYPGAAEALLEMLRPRCGALLFPLPPPCEAFTATYSMWVALEAPRPVQGPQPAACTLDEGHRIGWHWCAGTWWRALRHPAGGRGGLAGWSR